jgi:multiple sugar transport system permease protein
MRRWGHATVTFLIPALLWVLAFSLGPTVALVVGAFRAPRYDEAQGRTVVQWCGWDNLRRFLEDPELLRSALRTVGVATTVVVLEVILGLGLALLAWRVAGRLASVARGLLAMPMLMAPVAVAYLSTTVFAQDVGLLNGLAIRLFALDADALPAWRSDPWWSLVAIVLVDTWQWTPFCFVVFVAALAAQSLELQEAAVLDGAGPWAAFWHLTLPQLRPVLGTVALLRLIEALKLFDGPYGLTRGGPGTWTQSYSMWIKEIGFTRGDVGLASAMGVLLLATLTALATLVTPLLRRALAVERDQRSVSSP